MRSFGKLVFLDLREDGESIQVSANKKELDPERFAFVRALDVGDFVRVRGPVWRTKTDELSVAIHEAQLLTKTLRPLPEKFHGLSDVEARLRQRYLDLLANTEARSMAVTRSRTLRIELAETWAHFDPAGIALAAVDMPIGLAESGPRPCDLAARALLPRGRKSSVFPSPRRYMLDCPDWPTAHALGRRREGKGLSKETWNITGKIAEIDRAIPAGSKTAQVSARSKRSVRPRVSSRATTQPPRQPSSPATQVMVTSPAAVPCEILLTFC
jgi:hypothetical protein